MGFELLHCSRLPGGHLVLYSTGIPIPNSSWPVRNQAAQQEVSGGPVSEALSVFAAAPQR